MATTQNILTPSDWDSNNSFLLSADVRVLASYMGLGFNWSSSSSDYGTAIGPNSIVIDGDVTNLDNLVANFAQLDKFWLNIDGTGYDDHVILGNSAQNANFRTYWRLSAGNDTIEADESARLTLNLKSSLDDYTDGEYQYIDNVDYEVSWESDHYEVIVVRNGIQLGTTDVYGPVDDFDVYADANIRLSDQNEDFEYLGGKVSFHSGGGNDRIEISFENEVSSADQLLVQDFSKDDLIEVSYDSENAQLQDIMELYELPNIVKLRHNVDASATIVDFITPYGLIEDFLTFEGILYFSALTATDENEFEIRMSDVPSIVGYDGEGLTSGTSGDDIILSSSGAIQSLSGDDIVFTYNGNDNIETNEGNDTVYSGGGDDIISTGAGNDRVQLFSGANTVVLGDGDDQIATGSGVNTIDAGAGSDDFSFEGGVNVVTASSGKDDYYFSKADRGVDVTIIDYENLERMVFWNQDFEFDPLILGQQAIISYDENSDVTAISLFTNAVNEENAIKVNGEFQLFSIIEEDDNDIEIKLVEKLGTLEGDDTANSITGTTDDDIIFGFSGDDIIYDTLGYDAVSGGVGVDTYVVNLNDLEASLTENDKVQQLVISLGEGGGKFYGSWNPTTETFVAFGELTGFENVQIVGGSSAYVGGDDVDNHLEGGSGNDEIIGNAGEDNLNGGAGDDKLFGGAGNDILDGGAGDDILTDGTGLDVMDGGDGIDTFKRDFSSDYGDYLFTAHVNLLDGTISSPQYPDDAPDLLQNIENVELEGRFNYQITGDDNANILSTGDGDDTIDGGAGNDILDGGEGDDTLDGGAGDDKLFGGAGDDHIATLDGVDVVYAQAGEDDIILTADATWGTGYSAKNVSNDNSIGTNEKISLEGLNKFSDVVDGGDDVDTLILTTTNDAFFIDDVYSDHHSSLTLSLTTQGTDSIARIIDLEAIRAGEGNDLVDLTSANFILTDAIEIYGEAGDDTLWGSNGNDTIDGGEDNDTLFGGAGDDTLTGNAGADIFEFTATSGHDVITDLNISDGDTLEFYYEEGSTSDVADLSMLEGVLKWTTGTSTDVYIDLSSVVSDDNLEVVSSAVSFLEIV